MLSSLCSKKTEVRHHMERHEASHDVEERHLVEALEVYLFSMCLFT